MAYGLPAPPPRAQPLKRRDRPLLPLSSPPPRSSVAELGEFVSLSDATASDAPASFLNDPWDETPPPPSSCSSTRRYHGPSPMLHLHEDLLDFYEAYRPTPPEAEARSALVTRLSSLVASIWPQASIKVFGSYSTGLYLPQSDIDLVCVGTGTEQASKQERVNALHAFANALRHASWTSSSLEVIERAKVPIVKFVDGPSGVAVDVCIETRDGLVSSSLTKKAARQFPAYKVLVLVLKRFLHERGLHDTFSGGVGSFLLQLMVICSMQHPPSLQSWERGNLGCCLLHFLELFGLRFNYERVGIALDNGGR